ncbi:serine hydrolase domain-containing protein [Streptomyces sp. NPDC059816]|uniref:serine hydrolase domain-containing protein n=1 Tax=Streptomyces sp. NPDC059816 TaxID=3346960 RepID=UPI00364E248B
MAAEADTQIAGTQTAGAPAADALAAGARGGDTYVQGTVAEGFEGVRDAFERNFTERAEHGAALVVHRDGQQVVNLWAGARDLDGGPDGAPWARDTAQIVRSATKGVAAAALLLLHQRGALDLDAPVAAYWPEYAAEGKDGTSVRHVLAHRAGIPALDRPLTPAEAADPELTAAAVAAQRPFWTPGTDHGYHAHTYGWLAAELVRRVTGVPFGPWVDEHIARPLGLDLWVGLPPGEAHRVGRVGTSEAPATAADGPRLRPRRSVSAAYADPGSLTRRTFGAITPVPDENDPAYRAAVLPASNGVMTAQALSRFYAALIGPVDGQPRLFTPETVDLARAEASAGADRVLVINTRFGAGYMLHGPASPLLGAGSFGHPGRGGPLGFADPDSGIAFGYVTNGLRKSVTSDPRAQALVRAVRAAVAD